MAACESWSSSRTRFSYLFPFCFSLPLLLFFAWFLFCLRGFFFTCLVSFFICVVSFCLRYLFYLRSFFFIGLFSFLFACFLFCLRGFLFRLRGFFFVCSVSLVDHRKIVLFVQLVIWGVNLPHLAL